MIINEKEPLEIILEVVEQPHITLQA